MNDNKNNQAQPGIRDNFLMGSVSIDLFLKHSATGRPHGLVYVYCICMYKGRRKKYSKSCGHVRNSTVVQKPIFADTHKKNRCFDMHINRFRMIKHMILREKIQNNLKSFQIHIFTFQNILHLFILKEKKHLFLFLFDAFPKDLFRLKLNKS